MHRDRALNYKSEEVQLTAVDEIYVEQDMKGVVHRMIARVRIFFLGFISGWFLSLNTLNVFFIAILKKPRVPSKSTGPHYTKI